MSTAIVLSGGGSRGDFQLGALTALYEAGIRPDIICGTSVGALNALMLTQGDSGLDDLRRIWFGLRRNDHMWLFEDWWQEVHPELRQAVVGAMLEDPSSGDPASIALGTLGGAGLGSMLGPVGLLGGAMVGAAVAGDSNAAIAEAFTGDAVRKLLVILQTRARALLNLDPIRSLMSERVTQDNFAAFVASGKKLRLATVGLESGELCYVTETGDLLRRDSQSRLASGISLLDGAMASAAIATIFPPVNFAGDVWVDGGHRENVPLRAAIDADPNVTDVYVILSGPIDRWSAVNRTEDSLFDPAVPNFEERTILDIANRALLSIHLDEMEADDVYPVLDNNKSVRIRLIHPDNPTHNIVTIDPELIRVNYDYGYRSAWDVLNDAPAALREASTRIAVNQARVSRLRKRSWTGIGIPFAAEIDPLLSQAQEAAATREAAGARVAGTRGATPFSTGSDLVPGERLLPDQSLTSPDGRFMLIHQTDGHLVVYRTADNNPFAEVVWASGAFGHEPGLCVMQPDGNLVVYDAALQPRWASGTHGQPGLHLRLQIDGRVVLQDSAGHVAWDTARAGPDPVPEVRIITVVNQSAANLVLRFFSADDNAKVFTLGDGLHTVPAGGSLAWPLPSGFGQVKATFNGRDDRIMAAGESFTYDADVRVRIVNGSPRDIGIRIFRDSDPVRVFALPGGELSLPAGGEAFWTFPDDIEKAVLVIQGRQVQEAVRGSLIRYEQDDRILVRNQSDGRVNAKFYKDDDRLRWLTLPGGDLNVDGQSEAFYSVPTDVSVVQVVFGNRTVRANLGDVLVVGPDGSINRG